MSRRKRSRKIRSAHRRERRIERCEQFEKNKAIVDDLMMRERVRRTINSSDLPDSVKRAIGFMVSPAGQLNEEMRRIVEEKKYGS